MTLTLDIADLREAGDQALEQLGHSPEAEFDRKLTEIEVFLLTLYRFGVLAAKRETEFERAADVWRSAVDLIDGSVSRAQALASRRPGVHPALDRMLEIRYAASEMLKLHS